MTADTLFHAGLVDREFGNNLLHVPSLLEWVKAKRLHLKTSVPIEGAEFVQVDWLLVAIGEPFRTMDWDDAEALAANTPGLPTRGGSAGNRLAGHAARQWQSALTAAIEAGELILLDFLTKMPVQVPAAASDTKIAGRSSGLRWTPEFVEEVRAYRQTHTAQQTADHFGVTQSRIREKLRPGAAKKKAAGPWSGLTK